MICNTIGLTADSFESIYTTGGTEVEEVYGAIDYAQPIYAKIREMTGTLPLYFSGRGKPLTDYLIYGDTVQNGTPSSEAPVDVVGCGVWDETYQSYKLPITVNGTEYPIYLGQVPTTRWIKKLVLTGEENVALASIDANRVVGYFIMPTMNMKYSETGYCNILLWKNSYSQSEYDRIVANGNTRFYLSLAKSALPEPTFDGFKSYLAAQYAAGTPVTIWYVLANPETGIVNEPMHKIGDYADTISFAQAGVTIPTVSGANILDMTSTVKPSEVYIKGNGVKPTGYGKLADNNGVYILDKNGVHLTVHGQ